MKTAANKKPLPFSVTYKDVGRPDGPIDLMKIGQKDGKNGGKVAASIVLHDPAGYSPDGMRAIAAWAKRVIGDVKKWRKSQKLGKRFTARYYY